MVEIITLLTDIALGALAYRLAVENRRAIAGVKDQIAELQTRVGRLEVGEELE